MKNYINKIQNTKTRVAELKKCLEFLRKKDQEATIEIKDQTAQRRDSKSTTKQNNELYTDSVNINDTLTLSTKSLRLWN